MILIQSDISQEQEAVGLLNEVRELPAILSKSHRTARARRKMGVGRL